MPPVLTSSSQLLDECIKISGELPQIEGIGHLARANYKLSQILGDLGSVKESARYLETAVSLKENIKSLDGDYIPLNGAESDFESPVPWMLW